MENHSQYSSLLERISISPIKTLLLAALFIVALAPFSLKVTFENSPENFFIPGDETLIAYEQFKNRFTSDEYTIVQWRAPQPWSESFIEHLRAFRRSVSSLEGVVEVTDIANARSVAAEGNVIHIGDFIPRDATQELLADKQAVSATHPFLSGRYSAREGRYVATVIETEAISGQIDYKIELTERLEELLAQPSYQPYDPVMAGAPVLDAKMSQIVTRENALFGSLTYLMALIVLLLIFRSFSLAVFPLVVAGLSVLIAFSVMGLLGKPMTLLTPIVPAFMITVGIGPIIFFLTAAMTCVGEGQTRQQATAVALRKNCLPAGAAVITTSGALMAFALSDIAPVRDVGIVLSLSLPLCFLLSIALLPGAVFFASEKSLYRTQHLGKWQRHYGRLFDLVQRRKSWITLVFVVLGFIAALGVVLLKQDFYYLGSFKPDTQIRKDYEAIDEVFEATTSLEVILNTNQRNYFKDPDALANLERIQSSIEQYDDLPVMTYAVTDVLKEIGQALHQGEESAYKLPTERNMAGQYYLLFESSGRDDVRDLVTDDYSTARIRVQIPNRPYSEVKPLVDHINQAAATHLEGTPVASEVTGIVPLWMKINEYLTVTQLTSLGISLFIIVLMMTLLTRSLVTGLVISAVNAYAILMILGVMGWLGIPLDPYLILIAGIAIGILDDDTLHFIQHVRYEVAGGHSVNEALRHSYVHCAQAVSATSLVIAAAFSTYALSTMLSLTKFGFLIALTVLIGLICELFVMPLAILFLSRIGALKAPDRQHSATVETVKDGEVAG
ncbi:MAG: MMPL family transporter [Oleiphilaceae bacterium]|nr:MMPL family transporter [Oleiphilaceae bacterium]